MLTKLKLASYTLAIQLFAYTGHAQLSTFPPVGDATFTGTDCIQLTSENTYIMGAAWFDPQIDLSQPFDIRVKLNFGDIFHWDGTNTSNIYPEATGGADGIAFVMQQVSSAAGNLGEAMGYGLLTPSIAVEFDSYYNFNADPVYDHIAISRDGDHVHTGAPYGSYSQGTILPGATVVPALGTDPVADNIQTGQDYEARFVWDSQAQELEVWFNCQLKITLTEDIVNTIFGGNPNVYYGFTSATGSEYNQHTVCVIYNSATFDVPDETICVGDNVQLDATLPNADITTTYSWSPSTGLNNPNIPNPIASPTATTQYVVTIQQSCYPDPIYDTVNINVNQANSLTINPAGPYCDSDGDLNLTNNGGTGIWTGTGIVNQSTGLFSPSQAGQGSHQIIFEESGICGGTDTITIVVNPSSNAQITPSGPLCVADNAINLFSSGTSGVWSGTGITNITNGTFSPGTAGVGTHQIVYDDYDACTEGDTISIVVTPINVIQIDPAGPFCVIDNGVTLYTSGTNGIWAGSGVDPITGLFTPSLAGIGLHTISYSEPGNCGGNASIDIEVNDGTLVDILSVGPYCEGEIDQQLSATVPGGTWSGFGILNSQTGQFSPTTAGVGSHDIIYALGGNCPTSDTLTIIIDPIPEPSFTIDVPSGCAPLTVTFTNTTPGSFTDCDWNIGGAMIYNDCGPHTLTLHQSGTFDVTLSVSSQNGCNADITETGLIQVDQNPFAAFTPSPSVLSSLNTLVHFDNNSIGASGYIWNFGDNSPGSTETNPIHTFPTDAPAGYTVELIAYTENGCTDTAYHTILVQEELIFYVPNTFTPDGDEYNEIFKAVFTSGYDPTDFNLYIFDRWGEIIWESHDASVGWNGTYGVSRNKTVQDGTYIWKIDFKTTMSDERIMTVGHVNVLR